MNAETRRAIVWREIEQLAFSPSPADRGGWLTVYERTLANLWGRQGPEITIRRHSGFDADFLCLICDYSVEALDKFSVTITHGAASTCWHLDVTPGFDSKGSLYKCPNSHYPRELMDANLERDVAHVLEGMIFHPCAHAHGDKLGIQSLLQPAPPALGPREIRLGGGIENAFVFLTHLRYQFCLLSDAARTAERARMVRLFTDAIRSHSRTSISAAVLFAFRS
jgi:hypothetical protein